MIFSRQFWVLKALGWIHWYWWYSSDGLVVLNQPLWKNMMREWKWKFFPKVSGWKQKMFELPPPKTVVFSVGRAVSFRECTVLAAISAVSPMALFFPDRVFLNPPASRSCQSWFIQRFGSKQKQPGKLTRNTLKNYVNDCECMIWVWQNSRKTMRNTWKYIMKTYMKPIKLGLRCHYHLLPHIVLFHHFTLTSRVPWRAWWCWAGYESLPLKSGYIGVSHPNRSWVDSCWQWWTNCMAWQLNIHPRRLT